jgi:hypothetical protein
MFTAMSMLGTRAGVASYLGKSFGGDRDIYDALGYKKLPLFSDFMAHYRRQDIAKAAVDVPVRACWRKPPALTESEEEETAFEKQWAEVATKLRVWDYFSRVDRLASIGEYAVLLIGFDDGAQLWQPVKRATEVLYVMPYSQANASIATYVSDVKDPRYSLPEKYSINMRTAQGSQSSRTLQVHWSRVIHVSEDNLDDDILGLPRLEAVLNRLQDLDLVAGGSAEMFWRGAFPGFGLKLDDGATLGIQDEPKLEAEIEEYVHGLKRYMRLQGLSIENIAQQIGDPKNQADLYITLISAVTRIPKRILLGSEMGELASGQDEVNWYARVDERREGHCEPKIVRPFVDRLIEHGVLPAPKDGAYTCEWAPLLKQSEKEKADVAKTKSEAMSTYVGSGAETLVPRQFYLTDVMGYNRDQLDQIEEMIATQDEEADGDVPTDIDDVNADS